jgi:membrane dipeptidase
VIDEIVRLGIILDLSHTGKQVAMGAAYHMDENHPGVPNIFFSHCQPDCSKNGPNASPRLCYRSIAYDGVLRVRKATAMSPRPSRNE